MRFLKDLLFTDRYLIKGHIKTGGQRLSTFLNSTRKRFLEMEEATLIKHDGGERIHAELVSVRLNDILFAYEMEEAGDEGLRNLGVQAKAELEITIYLSADMPLQMSGMVRTRAMNSDALRKHDFVVMLNPILRGFAAKPAPEYALLKNVPYLIVNRDRISIIFQ